MREIKFRAWDTEDKVMFYNVVVSHLKVLLFENFEEDSTHMMGPKETGYIGFDAGVEVMQYTGLHDKNGREIYEGDIVESAMYGYEGEPMMIEFIAPSFCVTDNLDGSWGAIDSRDTLTVIGNIYENPDLLGKPAKA